MISADGSWIFVHIQKTGGSAIRAALGVQQNDAHKHFLARELRAVYGPETWTAAFRFAIVRNPWDRLVSWWSMINAQRRNPVNRFFAYVIERATTFEEFIELCTEEIVDSDGRKAIFRNQIDYLADEDGSLMVDFVGRFERLQDSFDSITKRLDLAPVALPVINTSPHGPYVDFYTPGLASAVGARYARDIETFGYEFGVT